MNTKTLIAIQRIYTDTLKAYETVPRVFPGSEASTPQEQQKLREYQLNRLRVLALAAVSEALDKAIER